MKFLWKIVFLIFNHSIGSTAWNHPKIKSLRTSLRSLLHTSKSNLMCGRSFFYCVNVKRRPIVEKEFCCAVSCSWRSIRHDTQEVLNYHLLHGHQTLQQLAVMSCANNIMRPYEHTMQWCRQGGCLWIYPPPRRVRLLQLNRSQENTLHLVKGPSSLHPLLMAPGLSNFYFLVMLLMPVPTNCQLQTMAMNAAQSL